MNFADLGTTLNIMLWGMVGIFVVTVVIMGAIKLLHIFFGKEKADTLEKKD